MSPAATLMGRPGRGYAVVESLPSLGKGRRCTGLFLGDREGREAFRRAMEERRRVPFQGTVHSRHRSGDALLRVELTRVAEDDGEVLVEFATEEIPYDLVGQGL